MRHTVGIAIFAWLSCAFAPSLPAQTRAWDSPAARRELVQSAVALHDRVWGDSALLYRCGLARTGAPWSVALVLDSAFAVRVRDGGVNACSEDARTPLEPSFEGRTVMALVRVIAQDAVVAGDRVVPARSYVLRVQTRSGRRELPFIVEEFTAVNVSEWAGAPRWVIITYRWWPRPEVD